MPVKSTEASTARVSETGSAGVWVACMSVRHGCACRVVNQLLTELDGATVRDAVFAIAATNRPDIIDPALLRPGRLDKTLYVPLPDAAGRAAILAATTRRTPLAADVDLAAIAAADACKGFSGADLASLLREAAVAALKVRMHPALGMHACSSMHAGGTTTMLRWILH